jgi:hypothetical protein
MTDQPEKTVEQTPEERRLQRGTDEAIGYLFNAPDEYEEFDFEEFRASIEEKGVTVTLDFPDGGGSVIPGDQFVEFVWGLIANA